MNKDNPTRRRWLQGGVGAMAALAATDFLSDTSFGHALPPEETDAWRGLKVGVASYTFRQFPLEQTIRFIQRVGLKYVSIKNTANHLALNTTTEQRRAVAQQFRAAGITPLSCGNVTMDNTEAGVRQVFEYARDVGLSAIVCSPHPDSMPLLDRMVKEFDIKLAIHNHGPGDKRFPSPYDAWKAVSKYDERIGLCIDVGHTVRVGVDPVQAILDCRARLYDMHLRDLTKPEHATIEAGRGALDLKGIFAALLKIKYQGLVAWEYDKDSHDPLPGLAESVGYTKGLLRGLK